MSDAASGEVQMRNGFVAGAVVVVVILPVDGRGQTAPRRVEPEVSGSLAWAHVFRVEDRTFGDELNAGVGLGFRVSRVGIELEVNHTFGLTAEPAWCGDRVCVGEARQGVLSATLASANVLYEFGEPRRARPYVTGGIGALWSRSVSSILTVRDDIGVFTERVNRNVGLALNVGAGLRVAVSRRFSIRPEIRIYDASARSRQNLTIVRSSVNAAVRW
jgi:opacity protein-like surface antigen